MKGNRRINFQYKANREPIGFVYNDEQYFYVTDNLGNVLFLTDNDGETFGIYDYDEWGNVTCAQLTNSYDDPNPTLHATIIDLNPIRYRGYYYDTETSYYYLQSRYYDPNMGRFINADVPEIAQQSKDEYDGLNLFAYCCNDPLSGYDPDGYKYSPSKAKSYASRYWKNYNTLYKRNSSDCANFVSQCIYDGGISPMTETWYHKVYGYQKSYMGGNSYVYTALGKISASWGKANDLYNWICKNHLQSSASKRVCDTRNKVESYAKEAYNKYKDPCCQVAIFFNFNKGDGIIDHAALMGEIKKEGNEYKIYYYAHTGDRSGKKQKYKVKKLETVK